MEVDAHCTRIGVNYEMSGHTATSLSGKISVEEGKNVQLKLRALEPEQKQELITIRCVAIMLCNYLKVINQALEQFIYDAGNHECGDACRDL